jgi:hypothetical protein
MTEINYSGWFQCRLATDPDPYDEPRGVSGYVHAYAGEPDLDRIIRFHNPAWHRTHAGITVGVYVDSVVRHGQRDDNDPLIGAQVKLLGNPKFEGRNGVIADDQLEPVYPFEVELTKDSFRMTRSVVPQDSSYPYPELFAIDSDAAPQKIAQLTGISDLPGLWRNRRRRLSDELAAAQEPTRTAITERINFLSRNLAADENGGAALFFGFRMHYLYNLASSTAISDPDAWLPEAADITDPWPIRFWFGGWDADLLCGFTQGTIYLGSTPEPAPPQQISLIKRRP